MELRVTNQQETFRQQKEGELSRSTTVATVSGKWLLLTLMLAGLHLQQWIVYTFVTAVTAVLLTYWT